MSPNSFLPGRPHRRYGARTALDLKSLVKQRKEHLNQYLSAERDGVCQRIRELAASEKEISTCARDPNVALIMRPTIGFCAGKILHNTDCRTLNGVQPDQLSSYRQY